MAEKTKVGIQLTEKWKKRWENAQWAEYTVTLKLPLGIFASFADTATKTNLNPNDAISVSIIGMFSALLDQENQIDERLLADDEGEVN